MDTATMMSLATGLTALRMLTRPEDVRARDLSRVLVGGVLATALLLAIETPFPSAGRGLAGVILTTSVLVHGVPLSQALIQYTEGDADDERWHPKGPPA